MRKKIKKYCIGPDYTILEAMKVISGGGIRGAFVVDKNLRLVGIVSDGDIRRAILRGKNLNTKIKYVMNPDPIFLLEEKKVDLIKLMVEKDILILPVVDKNGILKDFHYLPELITKNKVKKKKEKVLVIGGAGYVGSILVDILKSKGHDVRVLDILLYGEGSIKKLKRKYPTLEFIKGDIRNIEDIMKGLQGVKIIVHLGEIVGDPACNINPNYTIEINYIATRTLAEIAKESGVEKFIYISSCSVYGFGEKTFNEQSECNPLSLYAKCKLESERALKELQNNSFITVILRLATVFGISLRPRFDLIVNLLTAQAVKDKKIKIFGGEQWRPFIHVRDAAKAITTIIEYPHKDIGGEIFNVGADNLNYKIKHIGEIIKKTLPDTKVEILDEITDERSYKVSFKKIKEYFNFTPDFDLQRGIKEIVEFVKKNKIDYRKKEYSNYLNLVEKIEV